jgi:hypothetical protein
VVIALALAAALAPCAPATPPSLALTGIPPVAIPGRSYTATLTGDGPVIESAGSDIGVSDRTGKGWNAHFQYARGVTQAFSVGLTGAPFTVTASWTEPGPCTRTVSVPLPIERRILAVVGCRKGAEAPATLVVRCDASRLRLKHLRWTGWNGAAPVGKGTLNGRPATVTLTRPRECARLDGYIYTRAAVTTKRRALKRVAMDCPLPTRS